MTKTPPASNIAQTPTQTPKMARLIATKTMIVNSVRDLATAGWAAC